MEIRYSIVSLAIFLVSCNNNVPVNEYLRYVRSKENGLKKEIKSGDWLFSIQYRPTDYILLLETKGNIKKEDYQRRENALRGTVGFTISIERIDGIETPLRYGVFSQEEYNERLDYFLNKAVEDIGLIYDADTFRPVSYLFENNFNLTPQQTMVVSFDLPQNKEYPSRNMQLSYYDRIFNNGIIKAIFRNEDLKNIPKVIY